MNNKVEKVNLEEAIIGACIKNPEYIESIYEKIDENDLYAENQTVYESLMNIALYENIEHGELIIRLKRLGIDWLYYITEAEAHGIGSLKILDNNIYLWKDIVIQVKAEKFFSSSLESTLFLNRFELFFLKTTQVTCQYLYLSINFLYPSFPIK